MIKRAARWLLAPILVAGFLAAAALPAESKKPKEDYYELFKVLVDTMDQVERNYVKEVDRRKLIEAAIEGMLGELDPYSAYIKREEIQNFHSTVESEFGGIGIQISTSTGELTIVSPLVGTPAYRAGLMAGDRIVEIEGESTHGIDLDEAVRRLKGRPGTEVTLTVIHTNSKKKTVTVKREKIHVKTVLGDRRKKDDSWDFMFDRKQGIGYIRVTAFSRETAAEIRRAMVHLKASGLHALILDLRFNPGGLLSSAIEVSDLYISEGRIVSTEGRNSPERRWPARKFGTFEGFPMVVLVNRYTASASEIVSACLQDHKRAVIMGERTWGKGSVQNVIELEGGKSALKLTTASYRRPSGKNIHRFKDNGDDDEWGVIPDKGYRLRLGDTEILGLVEDRRRRDIVSPKNGETENGETENGETENGKAENGEGRETEEPFIDRQMKKAVEYLTSELARAD